ncbi:DUF6879 family protein [Nonomuraea typhae]|uniref:DUF6879 family protein n=1 Tax=Nonomuraea typhae TaxID=2603600 RepID=A0ABW7YWH2_9ACTN
MTVNFDELLAAASSSAVKLEMRDSYLTGDPGYLAWQEGDVAAAVKCYDDWAATVRTTVSRGVDMRRVRVVSEPVYAYIHFEYAVTDGVNILPGEKIRWLPRHQADMLLPANDVWIIDGQRLVWLFFDGNGDLAGSSLDDDPGRVAACLSAFNTAWEAGIDHSDYRLS